MYLRKSKANVRLSFWRYLQKLEISSAFFIFQNSEISISSQWGSNLGRGAWAPPPRRMSESCVFQCRNQHQIRSQFYSNMSNLPLNTDLLHCTKHCICLQSLASYTHNLSVNKSSTTVFNHSYACMEALQGTEEPQDTEEQLRMEVERLQNRVKTLDAKLRKERVKVCRLRRKVKGSGPSAKRLPLTAVNGYLEGPARTIFTAQVENAGRPTKKRKYSDDMKTLCLGLRYQSPKTYRFLKKSSSCQQKELCATASLV